MTESRPTIYELLSKADYRIAELEFENTELKASTAMAAEHMARDREYAARLESQVTALKLAITEHRDQRADDRCWMDDDKLYGVLTDGKASDRRVGDKEAMLKNCARYIQVRCERGHWQSYADLEAERNRLLSGLLEVVKAAQSVMPERKP